MMRKTLIKVLLPVILFCHVTSLNIVPGQSGEEQVKAALEKAQKESDDAAGNDDVKSTIDNANLELKTLPTSDLVSVLTKKFQEITKNRHNRIVGGNGNEQEPKIVTRMPQRKDDFDFSAEKDQNRKMVLIANKLNNLMQKFHKRQGHGDHPYMSKHGKLSYTAARPREQFNEEVLPFAHKPFPSPQRFREESPIVKSIQSFPLSQESGQMKNIQAMPLLQRLRKETGQVKSIRGHSGKAEIDLTALKKALGLLHKESEKGGDSYEKALGLLHKGNEKGDSDGSDAGPENSKSSYKEDTKLEDKLALEAEEEKKFSNGENYEYGMGQGDSKSSSSSSMSSTFSPKDQASKEMQSYNELISTESNRELNQIQEEISKATQSSLGDVSVVGQKEHVQTESPDNPMGGIGNLEGVDGMSQDSGGSMDGGGYSNNGPSMKGAIDASALGPVGNNESYPGSSAANAALEASLQASANADMNGESLPSDNEPTPQSETQISQGGNE